MNFMGEAYPWVKALHVVSMVAWMAGLLYLPRLFVYHAAATRGSELAATLEIMERRLLRAIILPAMLATIGFGVLLILTPGFDFKHQGWLHAKLLLVAILLVFTHLAGVWRKGLARGNARHSSKFFRMVNEIPTLLLIGIVILAVVKPF